MCCIPIILGSLNCITETIQVNDACKYFPQGPYVDQPWLTVSSARSIHSEDCVRLVFFVHLLLLIRVLFRQGTVKTAYPWTIHSAPPLQLTQKDVSKCNRYFPPHTKLHFLLVHLQTSTLCFETCFTVEDVCTYFLRVLRSNEFHRFCHKPDCFPTHAVIASTSTFHFPPQTRCFPRISNPLCTLHKICLLLSIRNEIRRESLFLQDKILLTPNHHEGVLRDVKVTLRFLSLDIMAWCAVCSTRLLRRHGQPHAYVYSWLQNRRASLWMMAIMKNRVGTDDVRSSS